jgi:hypothetical protein
MDVLRGVVVVVAASGGSEPEGGIPQFLGLNVANEEMELEISFRCYLC